jgi:hypothetical protein
MSGIVFTQHALERYMQRAKVRNVQTAMERIVFLAERVRPIAQGIFTYEDSACRNLKLLSKALAL